MSALRTVINAIYVLAFASSIAVAVKQMREAHASDPTIVRHASTFDPSGEARMVHLASLRSR